MHKLSCSCSSIQETRAANHGWDKSCCSCTKPSSSAIRACMVTCCSSRLSVRCPQLRLRHFAKAAAPPCMPGCTHFAGVRQCPAM
jgi:hypothetical protein